MTLTKQQRAQLQLFKSLHSGESAVRAMGRNFLLLASAIVLLGALGGTLAALLLPQGVTLIVGICLGALLTYVGQLKAILRVWPAIERVLDWEKVESVLSEDRGAKRS